MNCAILLAAGSGARMGTSVEDKILFPIMEIPVICYSVKAFTDTKKFDSYIIVYRDEAQKEQILEVLPSAFINKYQLRFIKGGDSRQRSVFNALQELESLEEPPEYVAIHDAARPLIASDFILKLLITAKKCQNAIPTTKLSDTIKQVDDVATGDSRLVHDLDRSKLRSVQTPQIFDFSLIHQCYGKIFESNQNITDDSSALTFSNIGINLVLNDQPNPKITTKNDLGYILYLLNQNPS